jgi:DNA-directed RNA polymerase omega subunit
MLYGRRLDDALEHVDGSRYALVHAVAKRARQITLWLTADPAELRAEAAPPPAAGELVTRDPVALAEAEILKGEVQVRWDPDGKADERDLLEPVPIYADPLLLDALSSDDDDEMELDDDAGVTPALAQALEADAPVVDASDDDEESDDDDAEVEEVDTAADDIEDVDDDIGIDDDDAVEVPLDDIVEAEPDDEDEM